MADYNYIVATGVIVPDTANTRQNVVNEFTGIFGDDLVTDDETAEGLWINAETTSRQSVVRNNAGMANQINPNLAGGPYLDAIWALTAGQRTRATRSTLTATITGVANTLIRQGSRATTTAGAIFRTTAAFIIPVSGTLTTATFESVDTGPVEAAANSLTQITDAILGWESVNNPAAAAPGQLTESDEAARQRRRQTLALQARSVSAAVTSRVASLPGVRSLAFRENTTNATDTIDGISLLAHSIWVSVDGGADDDIAMALLESKTGGTGWNGDQTVTVNDPNSRQNYVVRFDRPTPVAILLRITVRSDSNIIDPITTVRDAVLRYANGEIPGERGFVVSGDISPFEIAGAVNIDTPGIFITLAEVAMNQNSPTYQSTIFTIATDAIATVVASSITVVVV